MTSPTRVEESHDVHIDRLQPLFTAPLPDLYNGYDEYQPTSLSSHEERSSTPDRMPVAVDEDEANVSASSRSSLGKGSLAG